jgi:DNA-binding NarL/FixJ family response regulator
MNVRTPVFVYAADPVSQAGLEQILRTDAGLLVLPSGQIDEAQVAIVGVDEVDDGAVKAIAGVQRDGCPRVVVVAAVLDEHGVLAAGDAGALGMVRRAEATAERLGRVVRRVAAGEASVPTDLVAPLLGAVRRIRRGAAGVAVSPAALSVREQDVIRLLAEGRDTSEIATALSYSERTVKGVIHEVTSRLQLRNRSHVVAFALRNDML